jgi:hypothetical protein
MQGVNNALELGWLSSGTHQSNLAQPQYLVGFDIYTLYAFLTGLI